MEGGKVEHLSKSVKEYRGGHCPLVIRLHLHELDLLLEIRIMFKEQISDLDRTFRNRPPVEDPSQPDNPLLTDPSTATLTNKAESFDIGITFQ